MDIVIVGSCVQDLTSYAPYFPKPGESVRGTKFVTGFGGKGANQAVQASILGAKVAMVGKVGNDVFGPPTIANFKSRGINTDYCSTTDHASTGTATITVSETGQNSIVVVLGANELLSSDDVSKAESLIANSKILLCQLEIQQETILRAFQIADKHNVKIIFNPAPGLPDLNKDLVKYADILCPNENEAEILSGKPLKSVDDAQSIAVHLRGMVKPTATVIITLGEWGCVLMTPEHNQPEHIPATKVDAKDTTGAGDSFVGSLAYLLSTKPELTMAECVKKSLRIASISVQYPGTQTSYQPKDSMPQDIFD